MSRIVPVQNPRRAALSTAVATRLGDGVRREPIDTLGRQWVWWFAAKPAKRARGGGAKSQPRLSLKALEGENPKGAASSRHAKPMRGCEVLSEGRKPRNRGPASRLGAGALGRRSAGISAGGTVGGSFGRGNATETF
jgi:hypothetical protein